MPEKKTTQQEISCDACNGTGFPPATQPVQPGRRILSCSVQEMRRQGSSEGLDAGKKAGWDLPASSGVTLGEVALARQLMGGWPPHGIEVPNGGRQRSPATGAIHGQYYNNRS